MTGLIKALRMSENKEWNLLINVTVIVLYGQTLKTVLESVPVPMLPGFTFIHINNEFIC